MKRRRQTLTFVREHLDLFTDDELAGICEEYLARDHWSASEAIDMLFLSINWERRLCGDDRCGS
jgi:hypothetical protein